MAEWADGELAALVRRVLPPRRPEWRVQVVDNPDEACAMFAQDLLRVQRHWREAVYDAGLHSVMMHHPLSLVRLRGGARIGLEIWRARAIRREKQSLTEVPGYLARAVDGKRLAFDKNRKKAEFLALAAAQGPKSGPVLASPARVRRRRAMLDDLVSRMRYDGGFRVAAADYQRWFPASGMAVFRGYGAEGVPIVAVVNEATDGLAALQDHEFEDFMVRLRWDLERAGLTELGGSPRLAPEDDAVLAELGSAQG
ncbi:MULTISPECIES: hypothetical protein [Bradyrhizobium]|jgi:hypothetical protein|uniref:hypothetical protein n=1 Tax=Bradyrhizobium TaxID=374 RepID=UPI00047F85E4|nr:MULTISPECIES: hypothetical protein [Bradyrhizobium]MCS3445908.1 hypothetical protein [Bradyrhizobium elkanii]MCS3562960.1 hypothetical protein [Bradyrhizobium elkanii]MCW2147204.1 hypothetical protein [Bradyrhizobium elkanii]MCW2353718.1 hypothetical protein [Bradyrhizobium elkanii]MCW2380035.1 hypothetical protein [Bradyrhizobium elkanii]